MKLFGQALRAVVFFVLPLLVSATVPVLQGCGGGGGDCCKICSVGKACGDSCIAANETCKTNGGCACNK